MRISDLINAIGDDNVRIQFIDACADKLDWNARTGVTTVRFGTEQPIVRAPTAPGEDRREFDGWELQHLGAVVWMPRHEVHRLVREQKEVTFAECRPGLFRFNGTLCIKTEYRKMQVDGRADVPGDQVRWKMGTWSEAYVAATGEAFAGGVSTDEERAKLMVLPVGDAS